MADREIWLREVHLSQLLLQPRNTNASCAAVVLTQNNHFPFCAPSSLDSDHLSAKVSCYAKAKWEWRGAHLCRWKTILWNLSGQCVSISVALGDLESEPVSKTGLLLLEMPEAICLSAEWKWYDRGQVLCSRLQPTQLIFPLWWCLETQQSHWVRCCVGHVRHQKSTHFQKARQKHKLFFYGWVCT